MKVLNKVVIGMASLVLLTACGPSKCSYAKFHEEAVKAVEKAPEYKKMTAKGEIKSSLMNLTIDAVLEKKDGEWELTKGDALSATALIVYAASTADLVPEDSGTTYYCGKGFKAVKDKQTAVWNASGFLTSIKEDSGTSLKFSYSK